MPNVTLASTFRNAAHGNHIAAWMNRVSALRVQIEGVDHTWAGPNTLRVMAVEGDSTDGTRQALLRLASKFGLSRHDRFSLVTANHGGPVYGSVDTPERMQQLSFVGDVMLRHLAYGNDDVFLYVESDLKWSTGTMCSLIRRITDDHLSVVAPLVFAGDHFYDVWAFRKDGERFAPFYPYHRNLNTKGLTAVDSVGSCLAINGDVARGIRFSPRQNAWVGWCDEARSKGHLIHVDATLRVEHPT